jgi:iron-sulfur cluster assembly protein
MALDKPQENDETYKIDDLTFLADKDFMKDADPVKIDFISTGFHVTSNIKFDKSATCGSCSSASDSCG